MRPAWVADGVVFGYTGFALLTGIGTEAIGVLTGRPALQAQLERSVACRRLRQTDASWKVTGAGPIQEGDFLMRAKARCPAGDARLVEAGLMTRAGKRRFAPRPTEARRRSSMSIEPGRGGVSKIEGAR